MPKKALMIFFGHHKCASQYIDSVITAICALLGLKHVRCFFPMEELESNCKDGRSGKKQKALFLHKDPSINFISYENASIRLFKYLKDIEYRGFHVIRDPRDILVSAYFSHRYSHYVSKFLNPEMIDHRKYLNTVGFEEGLMAEMEFSSGNFNRIAKWPYSMPNIFESRFEILTTAPSEQFYRILRFIGFNFISPHSLARVNVYLNRMILKYFNLNFKNHLLSMRYLENILKYHCFEAKAGRSKGREDIKSHYRKGIAGEWKRYFTVKIKDEFKKRYGQLLVDLNYGKNLDW